MEAKLEELREIQEMMRQLQSRMTADGGFENEGVQPGPAAAKGGGGVAANAPPAV